MMAHHKHIVDQILYALNDDIINPAGVLSEVVLSSDDVITATDVDGCTYLIEISTVTNKTSKQSG
jgi:hypothetical protein